MKNTLPLLSAELQRPLLCTLAYAETVSRVLALNGRLDLSASSPGASAGSGRADADPSFEMVAPGLAKVSMIGSMTHRASQLSAASGMESYDALAASIRAAAADPAVKTILIEADTPGGTVAGIAEAATAVAEARKVKRVIVAANGRCCSAGYWIASQATEIWATDLSQIGSIGVVRAHVDQTAANAMEGIAFTYFYRGAHKIDGSPNVKMSDKAKALADAEVGLYYDKFIAAVAAGRGGRFTAKQAQATEAKIYIADEAKRLGLIDRVFKTWAEIERAAAGASSSTPAATASRIVTSTATGSAPAMSAEDRAKIAAAERARIAAEKAAAEQAAKIEEARQVARSMYNRSSASEERAMTSRERMIAAALAAKGGGK